MKAYIYSWNSICLSWRTKLSSWEHLLNACPGKRTVLSTVRARLCVTARTHCARCLRPPLFSFLRKAHHRDCPSQLCLTLSSGQSILFLVTLNVCLQCALLMFLFMPTGIFICILASFSQAILPARWLARTQEKNGVTIQMHLCWNKFGHKSAWVKTIHQFVFPSLLAFITKYHPEG